MPADLEPSIDAYGSKARRSALADFAELWALDGQHPTAAALGDYARDNGWTTLQDEAYTSPSTEADAVDEDIVDDPDGAGDVVFAVLDERADLLGARYPFRREGQRLRFTGAAHEPYLGLLCLTLAHSYGIPTSVEPTKVFEDLVSRVLEARFQRALNFSRLRATHPDFRSGLLAAGEVLELEPTPSSAPHAVKAKDEGVDVLAHLHWGDQRPGKWTAVGQATCGKSDTWPAKMAEVAVAGWTQYLNSVIDPLAFLAVPHHVEPGHFSYLVRSQRRLLLDRPRLARWLPGLSSDLVALVGAVRDSAVAEAP